MRLKRSLLGLFIPLCGLQQNKKTKENKKKNGIEELNNTEELNVPVYNVQGMKIDRSRAHGLVIVGGKKVVVK
jgi:hypothetical protein